MSWGCDNNNKLGLSWGSTRLKQLAWSLPTKSITQVGLNITMFLFCRIKILFELANIFKPDHPKHWLESIYPFNIAFNIGLNIELNIGFNIGLNMEFSIGFNIGIQYLGSILGFNIEFQYWV